jgi:hypothetical protein
LRQAAAPRLGLVEHLGHLRALATLAMSARSVAMRSASEREIGLPPRLGLGPFGEDAVARALDGLPHLVDRSDRSPCQNATASSDGVSVNITGAVKATAPPSASASFQWRQGGLDAEEIDRAGAPDEVEGRAVADQLPFDRVEQRLEEASTMLAETPTVDQRRPCPSSLSMSTRVTASVPPWVMRTLKSTSRMSSMIALVGAEVLGQRLGQRVDRAAVLPCPRPSIPRPTASSRRRSSPPPPPRTGVTIRSYLFLRRSTVTR